MRTASAVVLAIVALVGACGLRYESTRVASEPHRPSRRSSGDQPIHSAAASRNKAEVIKLQLANRADKSIQTRDEKTALMIAEKEQYMESAAALR